MAFDFIVKILTGLIYDIVYISSSKTEIFWRKKLKKCSIQEILIFIKLSETIRISCMKAK